MNYNEKSIVDLYNEYIQKFNDNWNVLSFITKDNLSDEKLNSININLGQLKYNVEKTRSHLSNLGIKEGSKVLYTIPNSPETIYIYIAIALLGAIAIPQFHMNPDHIKIDMCRKLKVDLIISNSVLVKSLISKVEKNEFKFATIDENSIDIYSLYNEIELSTMCNNSYLNNQFLISSSSGTTGVPKLLSMKQLNVATQIICSMKLSNADNLDRNYKCLGAFPMCTSGMNTLIGVVLEGACLMFTDDMSPVTFIEIIDKYKPDILAAPPAYFEAVISIPSINTINTDNVVRVISGMDFFTPSLLKKVKQKFKNLKQFYSGYGLSETCNIFMVEKYNFEDELPEVTSKLTLVDNLGNRIKIVAEDGSESKIGENGELYIKGPVVVDGYLNNEFETKNAFSDGWFKTGDIVKNEGNNSIQLLGRKKYLIKRGGKSISPILVQTVINKIQGVFDSAVVGVPHELYGEMIWAYIVKSNPNLELKDVMKILRKELVNYMVPDQISFIDAIPKNSGVGKINFEKLIEMAKNEI